MYYYVIEYMFIIVVYFETNEALKEAIESVDLPTVEEVEIPPSTPGNTSYYYRVLVTLTLLCVIISFVYHSKALLLLPKLLFLS